MNIENAIEFLEEHADELAGAGDYATADKIVEIIKLLDQIKK